MKLEELEELLTIEIINYRNFKEKMNITKKYRGKAKIEIYKDYVYVERKRLVS